MQLCCDGLDSLEVRGRAKDENPCPGVVAAPLPPPSSPPRPPNRARSCSAWRLHGRPVVIAIKRRQTMMSTCDQIKGGRVGRASSRRCAGSNERENKSSSDASSSPRRKASLTRAARRSLSYVRAVFSLPAPRAGVSSRGHGRRLRRRRAALRQQPMTGDDATAPRGGGEEEEEAREKVDEGERREAGEEAPGRVARRRREEEVVRCRAVRASEEAPRRTSIEWPRAV